MELLKSQEHIPLYQDVAGDLSNLISENNSFAALYINCSRIEKIERIFGKKHYSNVLDNMCSIILKMKGSLIRSNDMVVSIDAGSDEFLVFLSKKREDEKFYPSDLETLCDRVSQHLNKEAFPIVLPFLKGKPSINVGYAIILRNPVVRNERLLSKLIEDAKKMASYQAFKRLMRDKEKLQELILKESIRTLFQPIVNIAEERILGYEALTRGPAGTEYENPYILFDAATDTELVFELDCLCRKRALQNAKGLKKGLKLFINCMPSAILDPNLEGTSIKTVLEDLDILPENLVIEVTEREAIENYELFKKAVEHYLSIGLSIAVDDTGSGYSSLETVVELKPSFIKLDMSLVRDIHKNFMKQELVKAIYGLAKKMHSNVIAEGIESVEELNVLKESGVILAQGYLFAKPGNAFPEVHFPPR